MKTCNCGLKKNTLALYGSKQPALLPGHFASVQVTLIEPEGTRKTFNEVVRKHKTRCRDPGNLGPEDQSARQEPMQGHS